MKGKIIIPAIVTIFSFLGITYTACIKDNCSSSLCANGGICVNGACACVTGYEGVHCDTLWSQKFSGTWKVSEATQDANGVTEYGYTITARPSTTGNTFLIDGLENSVDSVYCVINDNRSFLMPAQLNADSTFSVQSGEGTLDTLTGNVTVNYTFTQNGISRTSNMTWSK
ncbi:cupin domain-containing protein [Taibaiella soli]|uniref:EGF-like domain-containing protein n=1 Tax=Taibaiella soli TaxID=1649169 RepID=A0A2W2BUL7_9BACT|nr:calcium-binding EGF-like domain-containing protein [Taibaiella soli]PZF71523.1 hypothetical protein DN068_17920 [Taibaiella soli]